MEGNHPDMINDLQTRLTYRLESMESFLDTEEPLGLDSREHQALSRQARAVRARLRSIQEELLCVGFLGGTGVGKSSILNRLADSPVTESSPRRPHTEAILVYAHGDAFLPDFLNPTDGLITEVRHHVESIRHLLLVDLPDFDSVRGDHRQTVLGIMEHLDLLVWITSPEKYADRRFYHMLGQAPKAGSNFFFVFNKTDQLLSTQAFTAEDDPLARVSASFLKTLRQALAERGEAEVDIEARTYFVSTLQAGGAWNQLPQFREQLFARRSLKQVSKIKTDNLDEEIRSLMEPLSRELSLTRRYRDRLDEILEQVQTDQQAWRQSLATPIAAWLEEAVRPRLSNHPACLNLLIGPGRLIARLGLEWRRFGQSAGTSGQVSLPEGVVEALHERLEQFATRTSTRLLQHSLPELLRSRMDKDLEATSESDSLLKEWQWFVTTAVQEYAPRRRRLFLLWQAVVYGLLAGLFVIALTSRQSWKELLAGPSPADLPPILFDILHTAFSQTGLAALLCLILLSLAAGIRFQSRFRRLTDTLAREYTEAISEQLLDSWQAKLQILVGKVHSVRNELAERARTLEELLDRSRGKAD
jgi:predicted GTPase